MANLPLAAMYIHSLHHYGLFLGHHLRLGFVPRKLKLASLSNSGCMNIL